MAAALAAGVEYGLSSESSYDGNKDLVFVKLTDSALRAIEDFLRNKGKLGTTPTIQFLPGNEGKISIPASGGGGQPAAATFHFSLSSNADMEGPQGSFECVRGSAVGGVGRARAARAARLEACGPMPRKMRVQANDDVYETTRHRLAADAEHLKSKGTRVIKPNQTDIGRKVKVRQAPGSGRPAVRPAPSGQRAAAPLPPSVAAALAPSGASAVACESSPPRLPSAAVSLRPAAPPTAHHPAAHPTAHPPAHLTAHPTAHPTGHPPAHPTGHPTNHHRPSPANPDIMKRPIKERLIQLLALRPYKKPELYARITSEGIRERERSVINTVLQQISLLKDNCYHLQRYIWNDVNEEWPFYTDEEKQILKRRKPQNLTPPLSSDSGQSGQSPSPRRSPSSASKRPTSSDAAQPQSKKQRISHYRKPTTPTQQQAGFFDSNFRRSSTLCGSPGGIGSSMSSGISSGASSGASSGERRAYSDDEPTHSVPIAASRDRDQFFNFNDRRNSEVKNGYTLSFGTAKDFCPSPMKRGDFRPSPNDGLRSRSPQGNGFRGRGSPGDSRQPGRPSRQSPGSPGDGRQPGRASRQSPGSPGDGRQPGRQLRPSPGAGTSPPPDAFRPSPMDGRVERVDAFRPSPADATDGDRGSGGTEQTDIRDEEYFNDSSYPPIDSCARRRLYKAEFAVLYKEYRQLHQRVNAVANAFCVLEARLKQAPPGSSLARGVQQQIVEEYRATQQDLGLQKDKRRFTYLHRKLAHIKSRVADYDNQQLISSTPAPTNGAAAEAEAY